MSIKLLLCCMSTFILSACSTGHNIGNADFNAIYSLNQKHLDQSTVANVAARGWTRQVVSNGVIWFNQHFDDLYGNPQEINVLAVNTVDPMVAIHPVKSQNGCETTSSMGQRTGAVAGVNGGFFCLGSNSLCAGGDVECPPGCEGRSLLKIKGKLLSSNCPTDTHTARAVFGIDQANNLSIRVIGPNAGWPQVIEAIGAGPNLVSVSPNGPVINITDEEFPWMHDLAPRSSLGITHNGILLIVTVDGRRADAEGMTIYQLAKFMLSLGVESAMNLDGGGSTTMYVQKQENNGVVNQPSDGNERPVYDGLFIYAPIKSFR